MIFPFERFKQNKLEVVKLQFFARPFVFKALLHSTANTRPISRLIAQNICKKKKNRINVSLAHSISHSMTQHDSRMHCQKLCKNVSGSAAHNFSLNLPVPSRANWARLRIGGQKKKAPVAFSSQPCSGWFHSLSVP